MHELLTQWQVTNDLSKRGVVWSHYSLKIQGHSEPRNNQIKKDLIARIQDISKQCQNLIPQFQNPHKGVSNYGISVGRLNLNCSVKSLAVSCRLSLMLDLACRNWRFSDISPQRISYLITKVVNTKKRLLRFWILSIIYWASGRRSLYWHFVARINGSTHNTSKNLVIQMCTS